MDRGTDAADKKLVGEWDLPFGGACHCHWNQLRRAVFARLSSASDHLRTKRRFRASGAMMENGGCLEHQSGIVIAPRNAVLL